MTYKDPLISIIIPAYNEAANIDWHYKKVTDFLNANHILYEIIYVNDGSNDDSLDTIKSIAKKHNSVRYVSFSRNFGKEAATTAGLKKAKGKAAIIIDADGQHPVELVKTFLDEWKNGYQVVVGVRSNSKGEGLLKTVGSKLFYVFLRLLGANESTQAGLTDFRLIDRKVIDEYNKLTEHNRVTRNLIDWMGFKRKLIPFTADKRHSGDASYSFKKLSKLAIDGIVKHSTRPLKYIGAIGFIVSSVSMFAGIFIIIEEYAMNDPLKIGVTGSALLAIFLSFMVGIVLVCQGLLALYLENVYYETQNRPLYIIDEDN
jgi:dolichol-phosphate mannosyltransferase